jgi:hypothetical protein
VANSSKDTDLIAVETIFDNNTLQTVFQHHVSLLANRFKRDNVYFLHSKIVLQGRVYNLPIARLVYHCFKKPFDMGDESILILAKNGDGMDIKPRNLKITSRGEKQKRASML